jgi:hypothetical protein
MLVLVIFGLVHMLHQLELMLNQVQLWLYLMNPENSRKEKFFFFFDWFRFWRFFFTKIASICLKRKTIFALAN